MTDQDTIARVLDAADRRRTERREFLRSAGTVGLAAGGSALLAACGAKNGNKSPTPTPTPTGTPTPTPTGTPTPTYSDADVLNFALNLEYLEAQFYLHAAFGTGLDAALLTGAGTAGAVTGGQKVNFTDTVVAQYAREIAADERAHVTFLRGQLGSALIAQPAIDISSSATGAFSKAAVAAGLISAGQSFDPYANDENFLLAAFLFEDVGVTAYNGAIGFIANPTIVEAAAGISAAEAYHAGLIRSTLYAKGIATPSLITSAGKISDARDSLDGPTDDDQGIATDGSGAANVVPANDSGIAFARTPAQVLNIVYLSSDAVKMGGFFPAGVNGTITTGGGATTTG